MAQLTQKTDERRRGQLSKTAILAGAIETASEEARWQAFDLLSRRGLEATLDLLRGRSAELAVSAAGQNQLLSLALDQAAASLESAGDIPSVNLKPLLSLNPLPEVAAAETKQKAMRFIADDAEVLRETFQSLFQLASDPRRPASAISERLYAQARLNEACWREVSLPAPDITRALMLAVVPALDGEAVRMRRPSHWYSRLFGAFYR